MWRTCHKMCAVCETLHPSFFPLCAISPIVGSALMLSSPIWLWNQHFKEGAVLIATGVTAWALSPVLIPVGIFGSICHIPNWSSDA